MCLQLATPCNPSVSWLFSCAQTCAARAMGYRIGGPWGSAPPDAAKKRLQAVNGGTIGCAATARRKANRAEENRFVTTYNKTFCAYLSFSSKLLPSAPAVFS